MDGNPIPSEYRCQHLFLLIGRNLLPNYVAAHLLLEPRGTAYLVHSPSTLDAAQALSSVLSRQGYCESHRISIRSGQPDSILNSVKVAAVQALHQGTVGLNYTGGTKVMAVHAYRAMEQASCETKRKTIYSYLDANDRRMVIDAVGTASQQSLPVGLSMQPSLDVLLELHRIHLVLRTPLRKTFLAATASMLAEVHSTQEGIDAWKHWCRCLRRAGPFSDFNSPGVLRQIELPNSGPLRAVTASVRQETALDAGGITLGQLKTWSPWSDLPNRIAMVQIAAWFDGSWLEHHIYAQLQAIAGSQHLHSDGMGIGLKTDPRLTPFDFELDVAAMRGYQLFALSCTRTSDTRSCKSKLMEAYIRGTQLGGDEARVGLVCCNDEPEIIRQQVEDAWGVKKRVRAFGRQDLLALADRLTEWFESTP